MSTNIRMRRLLGNMQTPTRRWGAMIPGRAPPRTCGSLSHQTHPTPTPSPDRRVENKSWEADSCLPQPLIATTPTITPKLHGQEAQPIHCHQATNLGAKKMNKKIMGSS
ncbi:hypothetical protein K1719_014954 [Acacia pycnantha]|nr:hypothetical protein K1719_014954 [Acacia pycnantha]